MAAENSRDWFRCLTSLFSVCAPVRGALESLKDLPSDFEGAFADRVGES